MSASKMITFKINLNVLLIEGMKIIKHQGSFNSEGGGGGGGDPLSALLKR